MGRSQLQVIQERLVLLVLLPGAGAQAEEGQLDWRGDWLAADPVGRDSERVQAVPAAAEAVAQCSQCSVVAARWLAAWTPLRWLLPEAENCIELGQQCPICLGPGGAAAAAEAVAHRPEAGTPAGGWGADSAALRLIIRANLASFCCLALHFGPADTIAVAARAGVLLRPCGPS